MSHGWDMSGFYYRSMDSRPTFYRQIVLAPCRPIVYQARHDKHRPVRRHAFQGYRARRSSRPRPSTRADAATTCCAPSDTDGVVRQNTLDLIGGLDFALPQDTRLDLQLFNRTFFDHDPSIVPKRNEPGFTILLNRKLNERVEAEVLWIRSLIRNDWMLRPRVTWNFRTDWQVRLGVDVFDGPPLGLFGQFANRDRVYTEVRYSF